MKGINMSSFASMLTAAYHHFGIKNVPELESRTREAWDYLSKDRERYIEVADEDTPEYLITTKCGVICKLLPLARRVIQDQEKGHVKKYTAIFYLMLSDEGNRYVCGYSYVKQFGNAMVDSVGYPVYRYLELKDMPEGFQLCPPQEISPAATKLDWEAYAMMFHVFAKLDRSGVANSIPHKTERAMAMYALASSREVTIQEEKYAGKLVSLAQEESLWEELLEDYRYRYKKELCLLVTPEKPYYILKTRHTYRYTRKENQEDIPGGPGKLANTTERVTYAFVELSQISRDMHPLYY